MDKTDVNSEQATSPRRRRKRAVPGQRSQPGDSRLCGEAVQEAKTRGLSLRAIAKELRIHRETARRYALAKSTPLYTRLKPATPLSDTINNHGDGHFR